MHQPTANDVSGLFRSIMYFALVITIMCFILIMYMEPKSAEFTITIVTIIVNMTTILCIRAYIKKSKR